MAIEYAPTGSSSPISEISVASGFVMSFEDIWVWVTAGHFMTEFEEALEQSAVEIRCCRLLDGYGVNPLTKEGVLVDYDSLPRACHYDEAIGLDLGFVVLPDIIAANLRANGIVALPEAGWLRQGEIEFEAYCMLGLPKDLLQLSGKSYTVGNVVFSVVREDDPPASLRKNVPRFYARIPDHISLESIVGMSGGPIFGFRRNENGGHNYWIAALQNGWDPRERVIAACPATIFGPLVAKWLVDLAKHGIDERDLPTIADQ